MCLMNTFTMEKSETVHAALTFDLLPTNFQNSPNVARRLCYPFQKVTVRKASSLDPLGTAGS